MNAGNVEDWKELNIKKEKITKHTAIVAYRLPVKQSILI